MASWNPATPSPNLKFEDSPAESFLSTPGEMYPSLFGSATTVTPHSMITPPQLSFDDEAGDSSVLILVDETESPGGPEKKSVKKRKSWGQVLPEPKTCLPPRYTLATQDMDDCRIMLTAH
jgi:transcriptional activator HAC1